ncbi:sensor histidine kinase [Paenibacillus planticolens]|uniref:histidine kinase n=1 Tax=Paenibacillus planticolens TaxID=2654976 RepID=A0ABX1ZGK9_9BACL|nr:HAMP domain-containing sensor histidine kinase [Paenibacillus planticolens]NOU98812.1 GHKL domain-containing protein [Paenibacillus planticolens]
MKINSESWMIMQRNQESLSSLLISSIPKILETHFDAIRNQSHAANMFVQTQQEFLFTSITEIQTGMIHALFMTAPKYRDYLVSSQAQGFEQGTFTARTLGEHDQIVLEISKNLNLTSQSILIAIIEQYEEDASKRVFLINRLMECNWNRFASFTQGYLASKEQQIDHLHSQKVSVMGQMAAGMAHEIRNPLASIKGFAQLAKHRLQQPVIKVDELTHYLDLSINEIDALNRLVTDFLLLSRKRDNTKHDDSVVDVKEVLQRVIGIAEQIVLSDEIHLSTHISEQELFTFGDASQLEQVFLNILKNAIDAMSNTNGAIQIWADTAANHIFIKISDNGTGMSKETLDRIYEPFFTTKENGTGIGLSICKQLIERHNGRIGYESEIGNGTAATITLPKFNS